MSSLFFDDGPSSKRGKILIATTVYENPDASYTYSIQNSREALHKAGFDTAYLLLSGNCHVDDARNAVIKDFLETDCTDLVFIDADVSWKPEDLLKLCQVDANVVGGVYPYRRRDVRNNVDKMPYRPLQGATAVDGLLEVDGLPTGFLRIRRHVLEAMADISQKYTKGDDVYPLIFERIIVDGQRFGGDINFCRKWRDTGGKLYAATEMRLGHAVKQVIMDSLGAMLRRQDGTTIKYVVDRIKSGTEEIADYIEAWDAIGNAWVALEDTLANAVILARKAKGPILETGSGLSTVLMAAATKQTVYCIEHSQYYADLTEEMARKAGVTNIAICTAPIVNGWYDLAELAELPDRFSLALNDGPPRKCGSRMDFFKHFGDKCGVIVCDDADNPNYADELKMWASNNKREIRFPYGRTCIILDKVK